MITVQDIFFESADMKMVLHAFVEAHESHFEAEVILPSHLEGNPRSLFRSPNNFDDAKQAFAWIADQVRKYLDAKTGRHVDLVRNPYLTPFIRKNDQRDILGKVGIDAPVIGAESSF